MSLHWNEKQYDEYLKRIGKSRPVESEEKDIKPAKFHNTKTLLDGILFDSKVESERYADLMLLQMGKVIRNLELQPRYLLQEEYVDGGGKKIREIEYVADFRYIERGVIVVEDVKSVFTAKDKMFRIKAKLLKKLYPDIDFRIVVKEKDSFEILK